ncbi:hypothetical protein ACFQ64_18725 [Streptomyces sp. NPDC056460]|uniref:hypothetical protein n=1 Tax=Streptomyces sp. NPDC056460 TaxID=3345825 RepID=UPI0036CD1966
MWNADEGGEKRVLIRGLADEGSVAVSWGSDPPGEAEARLRAEVVRVPFGDVVSRGDAGGAEAGVGQVSLDVGADPRQPCLGEDGSCAVVLPDGGGDLGACEADGDLLDARARRLVQKIVDAAGDHGVAAAPRRAFPRR